MSKNTCTGIESCKKLYFSGQTEKYNLLLNNKNKKTLQFYVNMIKYKRSRKF